MVDSDVVKLLRYLEAEMENVKNWREHESWHVDCACKQCKAIEAWLDLSWWRKLMAKLEL